MCLDKDYDELQHIIRVCNLCGQEKPLIEYSKNKKSNYGRQYTCKECSREYQKRQREERKTNGVVVPQIKRCSRCNEFKPSSAFYTDITAANGLSSQCRECTLRGLKEKLGRPKFVFPDGHRRCKQCKGVKPQSEFPPNRGKKSKCLECLAGNKEKMHAEAMARSAEVRLRARERTKEYHRVHREELRQKGKDYYKENQDRLKAQAVEYYWENRASALAQKKKWAKENIDVIRKKARQRAIIENGLPGSYSEQQWQTLCEMFNKRCPSCGKHRKLTVDHIIPITRDGSSNWITNIQPLCLSCNAAKGNRHDTDYRPDHIKEWARIEMEGVT